MNHWEQLGICKTLDKGIIKEAYMDKLTLFHPEEDPEGFQRLRAAYEMALREADEEEPEVDNSPVGLWLQNVQEVYEDFEQRINPAAWQELLQDEVCFQIDCAEEAGDKLLTFLMDFYRIPHVVWEVLEAHFSWKEKKEELYKAFPTGFIDFVINQSIYEDNIDYKKFKIESNKAYDNWFKLYFSLEEAIDEQKTEEAKALLAELKSLEIQHPAMTKLEIRYLLQVENIKEARSLAEKLSVEWEDDASVWYTLGQVAFAAKEIEKAITYYEKAREINPEHIGSCIGLGNCYMEKEQFEEAKECFEQATDAYPYNGYIRECLHRTNIGVVSIYKEQHEQNPDDTALSFKLAWIYFETYHYDECKKTAICIEPKEEDKPQYYDLMGRVSCALQQYEEALSYFDKWLESEEGKEEHQGYIYNQKGRQLQWLERYEEALTCYDKALAFSPQSIDNLNRKAVVLNKLGRYEEAISYCDEGITIDSNIAHLYMNKAEALYEMGEYREALDCCEEANVIYAYFVEVYTIQIKIYYDVRQYEEVLGVIKQVEELEIVNEEVLMYKAKALQALEKVEEAKEIYSELTKEGSEQDTAYYELACISSDEQAYEKALEQINKSIELKDELYKHYVRGLVYRKQGLYKEALSVYRYIIKQDPEADYAYNNQGLVYERLEKDEKAIKSYQKAIEINPNHPTANNNLGELYERHKKLKKALSCYTKQIEVEEDTYYYVNRGWCYISLDRLEEAKKDFEAAIALNPENGYAYNGIANVYKQQKKYKEATEYFKKMIEKEENSRYACRDIGQCYEELEEYEEAEKYYTLGIEKFPDEEGFYLSRGLLYANKKEYDKALADYYKSIEIDSDYAYAYNNIGVVYENLKDYKKAIKFYTRAIEIDPNHNKAYKNIASIYADRLKNYTKAINYYTKQLEVNGEDADIYRNRAEAYYELKQYKKAEVDYTKALNYYLEDLKKDDADACLQNNIGLCYEHLDQIDKAMAYYNESIALAPHCHNCKNKACHESYFRIGKIYEKQKDYEEALIYYKKAYDIDTEEETYKEAVEKLEKQNQGLNKLFKKAKAIFKK